MTPNCSDYHPSFCYFTPCAFLQYFCPFLLTALLQIRGSLPSTKALPEVRSLFSFLHFVFLLLGRFPYCVHVEHLFPSLYSIIPLHYRPQMSSSYWTSGRDGNSNSRLKRNAWLSAHFVLLLRRPLKQSTSVVSLFFLVITTVLTLTKVFSLDSHVSFFRSKPIDPSNFYRESFETFAKIVLKHLDDLGPMNLISLI